MYNSLNRTRRAVNGRECATRDPQIMRIGVVEQILGVTEQCVKDEQVPVRCAYNSHISNNDVFV